jgi:enterochelin esterase family protein
MLTNALMKITIIKLGLLTCLLLLLCHWTFPQTLSEVSHSQAISEPMVESPRLRQLKAQLAKEDPSALRRFWEAMATEHTPLVEPIPKETGKVLVTFLWRATPGTTGVKTAGGPMTRLLETDLWYTTLTMDPSIPIFYSFFPVETGEKERRAADPLNPRRFGISAEVKAALPLDLQVGAAWWEQTSMLLFRENPASRWTEEQPRTPKGKIEMFSVKEKKRAKSRRVWVYTPPNYNPKSSEPCRLMICFDGLSYLAEIPVPTILNNLLAAGKISPTVAVMIDNGDAKASAEDLDNHATFADFMATELVPWVRQRWRVSADPARTIICGYSRGGLGATYVAWKHPEVFGNVLAQSGAFWRGNEGGTSDPEWLTQQFKSSPKASLRFYVEVGAQETGKTPGGTIFIEANRHLRQALEGKGYDVRYVEVSGARHDPIHWRFQLADGILYLAGKGGR